MNIEIRQLILCFLRYEFLKKNLFIVGLLNTQIS